MLALAYGGYSPVKAEGKNYSDYVNPLMGTFVRTSIVDR